MSGGRLKGVVLEHGLGVLGEEVWGRKLGTSLVNVAVDEAVGHL